MDVVTTDDEAPTWPAGAAPTLTWAEDGARRSMAWAIDNVGVTGYTISRNTGAEEQLGAVNAYRFDDLEAGAEHIIRVTAVDAAGRRTLRPLLGTARQADESAPMWPLNAAILVSDLTETSVRLAWPSATDAAAELTYTLSWGEQSLPTSETSSRLITYRRGRHTPSQCLSAVMYRPPQTSHAVKNTRCIAADLCGRRCSQRRRIGEDFAVLRWLPAR